MTGRNDERPAEAIARLAAKAAGSAPMTLADLTAIMGVLRNPEGGCPWDVEQTFATIAPFTIEEAYEVADAIARGDLIDLKDELGDLLLQVVYHAQIASEDGAFDFDGVADGIARKMIRRHPHVFGDEATRAAVVLRGMWDRIKAEEAAAKQAATGKAPQVKSMLDGVPLALPALTRSVKIQQRAAKVGFDWTETAQILDKVKEEFAEFEEEIRAGRQAEIQEEFGDIMFALANLARRLDIDPEATLHTANRKFARRFGHIERSLRAEGRSPAEATLEEMEALWIEAKGLEKG